MRLILNSSLKSVVHKGTLLYETWRSLNSQQDRTVLFPDDMTDADIKTRLIRDVAPNTPVCDYTIGWTGSLAEKMNLMCSAIDTHLPSSTRDFCKAILMYLPDVLRSHHKLYRLVGSIEDQVYVMSVSMDQTQSLIQRLFPKFFETRRVDCRFRIICLSLEGESNLLNSPRLQQEKDGSLRIRWR